MAVYRAKENWKKNFPPMNYLVEGDTLIICGKAYTIKESFEWDGRLAYTTIDGPLFYADELERLD